MHCIMYYILFYIICFPFICSSAVWFRIFPDFMSLYFTFFQSTTFSAYRKSSWFDPRLGSTTRLWCANIGPHGIYQTCKEPAMLLSAVLLQACSLGLLIAGIKFHLFLHIIASDSPSSSLFCITKIIILFLFQFFYKQVISNNFR